jgi:hypothetical protein
MVGLLLLVCTVQMYEYGATVAEHPWFIRALPDAECGSKTSKRENGQHKTELDVTQQRKRVESRGHFHVSRIACSLPRSQACPASEASAVLSSVSLLFRAWRRA